RDEAERERHGEQVSGGLGVADQQAQVDAHEDQREPQPEQQSQREQRFGRAALRAPADHEGQRHDHQQVDGGVDDIRDTTAGDDGGGGHGHGPEAVHEPLLLVLGDLEGGVHEAERHGHGEHAGHREVDVTDAGALARDVHGGAEDVHEHQHHD